MPASPALTAAWNQAEALYSEGNPTAARDVLDHAAQVAIAAFGPDDPDVIETQRRLALAHRELEDWSAARRVLEQALSAGLLRYGEADPLMLSLFAELGTVAEQLGNRHEARRNFTKIIQYGPELLGHDHPYVRTAHEYLGGESAGPVYIPPPRQEPQWQRVYAVQPEAPRREPIETAWTEPAETWPAGSMPTETWPVISPPTEPWPAGTGQAEPVGQAPTDDETPVAVPPVPVPPVTAVAPAEATPIETWQPAAARDEADETAQTPLAQAPAQLRAVPPPPWQGGPLDPPMAPVPQPEWPFADPAAPVGQPPTLVPEDEPGVWRAAATNQPAYPQAERTASAYRVPPRRSRDRHRVAIPLLMLATVALLALAAAAVVTVVTFLSPPASHTSAGDASSAAPSEPTLTAPSGVTLRDHGGSVTLTWKDPSDGTLPFIVSFGPAGGQSHPAPPLPPGQTTFTVNGLNASMDYCFTVVAVYTTDQFAPSNLVCTKRDTHPTPSTSR